MSLFRRCHHDWEPKAIKAYTLQQRSAWDLATWIDTGVQTDIYYVCKTCHADRMRPVEGRFTFAEAKELFPKP